MQRPNNLKVGDRFRVIEKDGIYEVGEIISLKDDDGGDWPDFWNEDKSDYGYMFWSKLEPITQINQRCPCCRCGC